MQAAHNYRYVLKEQSDVTNSSFSSVFFSYLRYESDSANLFVKVSKNEKQQYQYAPPPPPPVLTPGFPMDPALVNDLDQFHHDSKDRHLDLPSPRLFPSNDKPTIVYIGYTITMHHVENIGQQETWATVDRALIPSSQADLKNQVDKHYKRGVTGLDQYMDLKVQGSKRKHISELIRDCTAMDPDYRFEYNIASIKHIPRREQSGLDTTTMQVILRRELRHGLDTQGPFLSSGCLPDLSTEYHYNRTHDPSSLSSDRDKRKFPSKTYSSNPGVHEHLHPQRTDAGPSHRPTKAPIVPSSYNLDT